jgi:Family of unknown function (DUF6282)
MFGHSRMTFHPCTRSLAGVIDIHCHCGPDSLPRTLDALDLARQARDRGMRAIVVKNHFEPTASIATLAAKVVPEVEVFGGITLNLAVGGMNPHAVDRMARVAGGRGRFVWMGSLETESHIRYSGENQPYVSLLRGGDLLPEVHRVLEVIAHYGLVLETGHWRAGEVLLLVREARSYGIEKIVVTHAMIAPIHMQIEQMQEAAAAGCWIEFVYNGLIGPFKEFEPADYARSLHAVGFDKCILSSDLGQPKNPAHPDGLAAFFDKLEHEGVSSADIDLMSKTNPARILGLDNLNRESGARWTAESSCKQQQPQL